MVDLKRGDCLDLMQTLEKESVDMILCDLPYGTITDKTRARWDNDLDYDKLCEEYKRVIKKNGAIVLFGNEPFSSIIRVKLMELYKYDFKWVKSKTTGFINANYRPMNKYEDIMVFSFANASAGGKANPMVYHPQGLIEVDKERKNRANRMGIVSNDTNNNKETNQINQEGTTYVQKYTNYPCSILYFDSPTEHLHPTQKPVELLEYLIKTYTDEGNIVLDNTMGSGSTGVACLNTKRNFIGMELDTHYFEVAQKRIKDREEELTRVLW